MSRHPGTEHMLRLFEQQPVPDPTREQMDWVRNHCTALAETMTEMLADGPELTAGLRKLLEAKDCFVRALL